MYRSAVLKLHNVVATWYCMATWRTVAAEEVKAKMTMYGTRFSKAASIGIKLARYEEDKAFLWEELGSYYSGLAADVPPMCDQRTTWAANLEGHVTNCALAMVSGLCGGCFGEVTYAAGQVYHLLIIYLLWYWEGLGGWG